jgi:hypothetical protein
VEWLLGAAKTSDIVLLFHPDNVLAEPGLTRDLETLITSLDTKLLQ